LLWEGVRLILIQPELSAAPEADNFAAVRRTLDRGSIAPSAEDLLLLPERVTAADSRAEYLGALGVLAREVGCSVIGGSHHQRRAAAWVNAGAAVDASGNVLGEYEKVRPYANERASVVPGRAPGQLEIGGRRVLVLICADFWFSDLFERATALPDIVLVPALSVSRKPSPDYSRALWRHLAVARAYEFGCFVGVSDWGHGSTLPFLAASGVGGLANPSTTDPEQLFRPIATDGASVFELDFDALDAFREDRRARGFFWKAPEA
jgi:predicted amidohydrolase